MLTFSTQKKEKKIKKKNWVKEKKIKRGIMWNILEYSNSQPWNLQKIDE